MSQNPQYPSHLPIAWSKSLLLLVMVVIGALLCPPTALADDEDEGGGRKIGRFIRGLLESQLENRDRNDHRDRDRDRYQQPGYPGGYQPLPNDTRYYLPQENERVRLDDRQVAQTRTIVQQMGFQVDRLKSLLEDYRRRDNRFEATMGDIRALQNHCQTLQEYLRLDQPRYEGVSQSIYAAQTSWQSLLVELRQIGVGADISMYVPYFDQSFQTLTALYPAASQLPILPGPGPGPGSGIGGGSGNQAYWLVSAVAQLEQNLTHLTHDVEIEFGNNPRQTSLVTAIQQCDRTMKQIYADTRQGIGSSRLAGSYANVVTMWNSFANQFPRQTTDHTRESVRGFLQADRQLRQVFNFSNLAPLQDPFLDYGLPPGFPGNGGNNLDPNLNQQLLNAAQQLNVALERLTGSISMRTLSRHQSPYDLVAETRQVLDNAAELVQLLQRGSSIRQVQITYQQFRRAWQRLEQGLNTVPEINVSQNSSLGQLFNSINQIDRSMQTWLGWQSNPGPGIPEQPFPDNSPQVQLSRLASQLAADSYQLQMYLHNQRHPLEKLSNTFSQEVGQLQQLVNQGASHRQISNSFDTVLSRWDTFAAEIERQDRNRRSPLSQYASQIGRGLKALQDYLSTYNR